MTSPPNITFGYLQMEERYKSLERTIKKLQLNQRENKTATNQILELQSCASSVNGNMLDGETSSRVGSEVVSSSTNMRNILSQRLNTPTHGIKTSSVENSPEVIDRAIMPPPRTIGILAHSSRRNSLASPQIVPKTITSGIESNTSVISAINYPSATDFDKSKQQSNILHSTLDTDKPDRIFQQWKVGLSNKGELLIKGFIEGNKYVRSKPVIERINATTVKSFFSHIYSLQGRIHDEANELPEYVRGKFYNGFPDDWKNVHHVWQSFVAGGCSDDFRWPTPITDSDDDLISEITEVNVSPKFLKRSRDKKRLLRSHDSTKDFSKKPTIESSVKQKLASPRHPSVKSAGQISGDPQSSVFQASTESLQKDLNKSPRSRSRVNHEVEKVAADSDNESRQEVDKALGKILLNSSNVQPSDEQFETLKAFSVLLKNKKYSVEFLENIVEMSNSLMSVITRTSDEHPAQSNNSSKNHSATYPKAGINKNLSVTPNKIFREQALDQVSRKYSAKNNSKYVPVRRKLSNCHYDSSDEFDSHDDDDERYDSRYALKPRSIRVPSKRFHERPERINHARRRRSLDSENSDLDDFPHKNKKSLVSPAYDDRRKNTNVIEPERKKFSRNEIRKPIQSQHIVKNSRIPLPRPTYPHDRGGAESTSTITGFLANYDSCASITEDERALRIIGRQKMNLEQMNKNVIAPVVHKYPVNYDSCISITEDESSRLKRVIKENNYKKPVLQETNSQYLDQVMKRTTIRRLNQIDGHEKPQQRPKTHMTSVPTKEFPQAVSSKATMTDDKENEGIANSQVLHPISPKIIQREERVDPANKVILEKIKPTIVSVEKIAIKLNPHQMESPSRKIKSPKKIIDKQLTEDKLIKKSYRPTDDKAKILNSPETLEPNLPDRSKSIDKYPRDTRNNKLLEIQSKIVFGSEKNPKVLTCWMPNIKKSSEKKYGLVFEGKLLNEAGHVSTKKYVTDTIIRRVTPKLVETLNNEFYELSGDMVNTKHVVPQELQKLCLDGCPAKIAAFCEKWAKIKNDNSSVSTQSLNGSIDIASTTTSSYGRRILPTLRYWEGERLSMKGDEVYYNPGHFQELIVSSNEASRKDTSQSSPRKHNSSSKNELTKLKKNQSHSEKEKKSKQSAGQDDLVNAKQLKDNNNYNLNVNKSSAKKIESPRASDNRRRSQRFRNLKRKSYQEVKLPIDSSDSDNGKLQSKRRRNVVHRNELRPEDNEKKLVSKKKLKHDRSSSDSDKTPQGTSYQYRKVAYHDKFFSDE